jgi:hypothetical protein
MFLSMKYFYIKVEGMLDVSSLGFYKHYWQKNS